MKHSLLLSFVLAVFVAAPAMLNAAEPVVMIVWLTNGETASVELSDKPKVTCSDTLVVVKTDSLELNLPLKQLQKFTFQESTTAVMPLLMEPAAPQERAVYDINGRLVTKEIDLLDELPQGIYIVRQGSLTYKVMRR